MPYTTTGTYFQLRTHDFYVNTQVNNKVGKWYKAATFGQEFNPSGISFYLEFTKKIPKQFGMTSGNMKDDVFLSVTQEYSDYKKKSKCS